MTETVIIALISAISGSLIKPLFDYLTQRESTKDERDIAAYERAINEIKRKDEDIKELKSELTETESTLQEWRDKYYHVLIKTNMGAEGKERESLKQLLEEIISDKE